VKGALWAVKNQGLAPLFEGTSFGPRFFCRPVPACLARANVLELVQDAMATGLPGWLAQPEGEVLLVRLGFLPGKLDRGAMAWT